MRYKITTLKNSTPFTYTLSAQSLQEAKAKAELKDHISPIKITPIDFGFSTIPQKHIIQSLEQLHLLLSSHLSIQECFLLLIPNTPHKRLKSILESIHQNLENGLDLYESFSPYEHIFGSLALKMLYFGAKSNNLTECLSLLLSHLKSYQQSKSKIYWALFYPLIVLCASLACFGVLLQFVVPQFVELFASNQVALPFYTQILIALSNFLQHYGAILLSAFAFVLLSLIYSFKAKRFLYQPTLSLALHLPLSQQILLAHYRYEYCMILSILLSCKIDLKSATLLAQETIPAQTLRNKLAKAQNMLYSGKPLSEALKDFLSPLSIGLIHSAQQGQKIPEVLELCAQKYKDQAQTLTQILIASIEPILTVLLGGFILFLALGIFVPIWEMH